MTVRVAAGSKVRRAGRPAILLALLLAAALGVWLTQPGAAQSGAQAGASKTSTLRLCRFGVNDAGHTGGDFDLLPLRAGWYINYAAELSPPLADEAVYTRVIRLWQNAAGSNPSYGFFPSENDLLAAVQANPGADWLIGNEPDRRHYQDDLEPQVYAEAYHHLYTLIKSEDPGARILAGNIVQPTPLRLLYLDMVLAAYQDAYGERLPADGWSIHNFILNEISCQYDDTNCWGAEVPRGINAPFGEVLTVEDSDRLDLFTERIARFRRWMFERGYGHLPLYLSEYGILFPQDYGFPPERVNAFMNATFDYLEQARDAQYGYSEDDRRLVQRWSWYSTDDPFFNGWLYDSAPNTLSPMGQNFADFVSTVAAYHDLLPARVWTTPPSPFSQGGPVSLTLSAAVGNSGNMQSPSGPAVVRFFEGDPNKGGVQIGSDQIVSLSGCGRSAIVSVDWPLVSPGLHQVYVVVDEGGGAYEGNNTRIRPVLVATERALLPIVGH
jgi:hypothetical protein